MIEITSEAHYQDDNSQWDSAQLPDKSTQHYRFISALLPIGTVCGWCWTDTVLAWAMRLFCMIAYSLNDVASGMSTDKIALLLKR